MLEVKILINMHYVFQRKQAVNLVPQSILHFAALVVF